MSTACFTKTIGIIGGAGPMASCYLYKRILEICQSKYGANDYHEFPEIVLISYPFTRGDPKKIQADLALCFGKLKEANATVIGIASNSFHGYLPDISDVEFVHLVNDSISEAKSMGIAKVLVLSAQKTIELKLYEKDGVIIVYPSKTDQVEVSRIIREIAGGVVNSEQAETLKRIISHADSIQGVIVACTELPLVHQTFPLSDQLPVIDTVEVLAQRLIALAR